MGRVNEGRANLLDRPPVRGERVTRLQVPVDVEVTARWSDGVVHAHHGSATHFAGDVVHVSWNGDRYGGQAMAWMPADDIRRL